MRLESHRSAGVCPNPAKQLTGLIKGSYSPRDGSLWGLNGNAGVGTARDGPMPINLRLPPQL